MVTICQGEDPPHTKVTWDLLVMVLWGKHRALLSIVTVAGNVWVVVLKTRNEMRFVAEGAHLDAICLGRRLHHIQHHFFQNLVMYPSLRRGWIQGHMHTNRKCKARAATMTDDGAAWPAISAISNAMKYVVVADHLAVMRLARHSNGEGQLCLCHLSSI